MNLLKAISDKVLPGIRVREDFYDSIVSLFLHEYISSIKITGAGTYGYRFILCLVLTKAPYHFNFGGRNKERRKPFPGLRSL